MRLIAAILLVIVPGVAAACPPEPFIQGVPGASASAQAGAGASASAQAHSGVPQFMPQQAPQAFVPQQQFIPQTTFVPQTTYVPQTTFIPQQTFAVAAAPIVYAQPFVVEAPRRGFRLFGGRSVTRARATTVTRGW